ncbi:MAG: response regulator transcription factor, partial [Candidatus Poribacteria bacterium]
DVVVVGVPCDVGAGFTATMDIRINAPDAGIVVLAGRDADARVGMAPGVRGYLTKDCEVDDLLAAVRGARPDRTYSTSLVDQSLLRSEHEPAYDQVKPTAWERQVIALIAAGYKHKEIAARLGSSYRAIQGCHARIRHEMRLESRAEIVEYATREGLLNLPA